MKSIRMIRSLSIGMFIGALMASALIAPAFSSSAKGVAPDFSLLDRDGQQVTLSEFRGRVVLINFWATWCAPCRKEMPLLEQIYQRYAPLGVTLLGVNVEEGPREAEVFLRETPVTFPVLFDSENVVSKLYQVEAMPTTVLVDRQGNIRFVHYGYQPGYENEYQDQIRTLVRERL